MAAIYHLPNRKYFVNISTKTEEEFFAMLSNLYMYASLELLSLVVLHVTFRRKFGLPGLSQLAFVLETQWVMVQSSLASWVIYNAQPPLLHSGRRSSLSLLRAS